MVAQSRHARRRFRCPLSGARRTCAAAAAGMSIAIAPIAGSPSSRNLIAIRIKRPARHGVQQFDRAAGSRRAKSEFLWRIRRKHYGEHSQRWRWLPAPVVTNGQARRITPGRPCEALVRQGFRLCPPAPHSLLPVTGRLASAVASARRTRTRRS
jgi:hypothetical protein